MDKMTRICGGIHDMVANPAALIPLPDGGQLDPATSIIHYTDNDEYEAAVIKSMSPGAGEILRQLWGVK